MWGSALAIKWGAAKKAVSLEDGKGQGNNIAVFPTFVAGICAQLDLWRTSKNYRNKRFADAIAIWAGHNEVPSYIAFCKKRVPGLTENTIMNDAFWSGPQGIAFLKAQAWHEAGQKYPAPDEDWLEAQRIVFGAAPVSRAKQPAEPNIQPQRGSYSLDVEVLQKELIALKYFEVGDPDGLWGGKTRAGVTAFMNDRGQPTDGAFTPAVTTEIGQAKAEGWTRPIAEARANVSAKDLAPAVPAVQQTLWQRLAAKVTGWGAMVLAALKGASDYFDGLREKVQPVMDFFTDVPGWLWLLGIGGAALLLYLSANKATNSIVEDKRSGRLN